MTSRDAHLQEALRQLRAYGLLLVQDALLPCVTTIVAGGPVRGSWLGDPSARETYSVLVGLEEHPEVLQTKLVSGKVTMVHRDLWPAVLGVAMARTAWQFQGLSPLAKWLLESVDRQGSLQTDLVPLPAGSGRKSIPPAARELERRLLVHGSEVHTPSGAHAKVLQTWSRWLAETPLEMHVPSEVSGREQLDRVMERINQKCGAAATLPWQPTGARKRK
jgi:hypothetical protein